MSDLRDLVDKFYGLPGDKHILEVSLTELREWLAENARLRLSLREANQYIKKLQRTAEG
jgi:hypothetical protein